jgi:predicted nucleic acid-binding protein
VAALGLDALVAMSAVLDEASADLARAILRRVAEAGALVPNLWHLEVGQALLVAEQQLRIDTTGRQRAQTLPLDLPVTVDAETSSRAMRDTATIAAGQRLSLYDAAYLELGRRCELPLATFDTNLRRAASAIGVVLLSCWTVRQMALTEVQDFRARISSTYNLRLIPSGIARQI